MAESFRFKISVECDVMNADSEAIARTAAFALLTQMQAEKKKGRPSSDAKATITGVRIIDPVEEKKPVVYRGTGVRSMKQEDVPAEETTDVTE